MTYAERQQARAAIPKPAYKISRGKKDITEYPDKAKPQTRRARFFDPESDFGKKSLVYQLKTGQLGDNLRTLGQAGNQNASGPDLGGGPEAGDVFSKAIREFSKDSDRKRSGRSEPPRITQDTFDLRSPREIREAREYPLSVPHTTAASQFLYGKSVVEAALRGGRRELYKLYIYRPSNTSASRREQFAKDNTPPDFTLENLAQEKGIKVVVLREEGLRVMEKMSGGRPHNNYVLEASPLPQRPVVSLGPLSEDAKKPGFSLNLGHQSAEEAALIKEPVDFVATPAQDTHRPLVVVLHGVLDPGNVGAILRSASFLGATAVATTKRGSASMTPVVLKAAAGASEALTLFSVDSVERFLDESRASGWAVYAAVPPPPAGKKQSRPHLDMREVEETDPLAEKPCILLMGSEGEGLSRTVRKRADFDLNIPNVLGTSETIDSLNVSVAAGLLCNAFLRGKVHAKMEKEREEEKKFALW
ncbi:Alpha/beta knot methyltransferase [Lasiosphaeria hispida]|uniref:rRNA methyltransferase 1, mitochondrial n=1 Tax=Lasiosphaeria hispida TaxID=260671 RepID=A0AAJ0HRK4_9PEZI|nr:Alpha/beta knot methyltransferase [Lasiosphaeria hispida]